MQRVGLKLQPEQFKKLSQLLDNGALDIASIAPLQPDNEDNPFLIQTLADLLTQAYEQTQQILEKF